MTTVRSSSRAHLPEQQSQALLRGTPDDAARRFSELFSKRGFEVTERLKRKGDATLYVFKGRRMAVTTVKNTGFGMAGSVKTVGSAFYVLLTPDADTTRVDLFGKPTIDGRAVCSDEPPAWVPLCQGDVSTEAMWGGGEQVTGREEAETISGLLLEMSLSGSGGPGSMVAMPEAGPVTPSCVASELPEWKTASAPEKKKLLEKCRAPASSEGAQAADTK
ncbi:hypothetical protein HPC49_25330 [Pyxidicoccus fallax]|uniref:Uncharacterized protein n=1 Tax=Pyxidicoccus fallax TaxID=394095 RepID=A0A848LND8_9BACT|nr:hypothetical protein [Pyxidicoccus fallax]NMO19172.1 hypothetical protein [Pyxidicoccus fallax]NPC81534.1 hypothetical protein [Pyxidicoccus fallax]